MAKKREVTSENFGELLIESAQEAVEIAQGRKEPARVTQYVTATEITTGSGRTVLTLDPKAEGRKVPVQVDAACKVVDGPWGSKALTHPDFVITEAGNPRLGKQQAHSLEVALATGYATRA